ncbi:hypothetical protein FISHEDRAFT_70291 [Fistulina hepatica ATCC 64428]|uniref:Uncharacterized protein n=1 Tax=Fistulina hepatica ATCC 64428 TaxID=1128425 RepID=A0A0D7AKD3_9AGAR|nr:hypothetical protein FISHEDRAFT_70291 [Fistulina hepatica ATCC 64428]
MLSEEHVESFAAHMRGAFARADQPDTVSRSIMDKDFKIVPSSTSLFPSLIRPNTSANLGLHLRMSDFWLLITLLAHVEALQFGAECLTDIPRDGTFAPFWFKLHLGPEQWPPEEEDPPAFHAKMTELFERYRQLNLKLNKYVCQVLDIPQAVLDDYFPPKP